MYDVLAPTCVSHLYLSWAFGRQARGARAGLPTITGRISSKITAPHPSFMVAWHRLAISLAALLGAATARIPNPMQTVLLTDAVNATGARCLDGTPQR